jgi:penicillin amidase
MGNTPTTFHGKPTHPSAHPLRRALTAGSAVLVLLVAGALGWFCWRARLSLPRLDGTLQLAGLKHPVEVLRDAHGVPHLRAQSLSDLLFAQGYVTAQDRLWQMDLGRRSAFGELSEILGPRALRADIENRTLGLRAAAARAVEEMDPDSRRMLTAYTDGVNAFISAHRNRLPIEFVILHYQPRPWHLADCFAVPLNMMKTLNSSWRLDLMREFILSRVGSRLYQDMFPDSSPLDRPVAEMVRGPVRSVQPNGQGFLAEQFRPGESRVDLSLAELLRPLGDSALALGSNDWVVSGVHTDSGKPLLSNDPHLHLGVPGVWYQIQLESPQVDVTGVSLPGVPAVIIGHNQRIAWGMTNTGPDVQDLFIEKFNPQHPNQYLYDGRWQQAEIRREIIHVRGRPDDQFTVRVTRHGPIISHEGGRDLALEWTALKPHALNVATFVKLDEAQDWQQFKDALRTFSGPEQNMVYADADGNIGYYAAGWVPVRKKGDGSLPAPGDTDEYDWQGCIPFQDLPHAYNPPEGIIATANSRVVPDGYPYFITHDWEAPWRTARIYQLLEARQKMTVRDMLRIDSDIYSVEDEWLASWLIKAGKARPPRNPQMQEALRILGKWDGEARMRSAATLICEATRQALLERLLRPKLGRDYTFYHWGLRMTFVDNVLRNQWARWLPPGDADFNVTLMESLQGALRRIAQLTGSSDPGRWQWGKTIPLVFRHPLDALPLMKYIFDVGPFPQRGMATTIKATTPNLGPSMRMVVDFSNFDQSVGNITLGESGQVFSPYYKDQFAAWYNGRSFPMLFSIRAVGKAAAHKLTLEPATSPSSSAGQ